MSPEADTGLRTVGQNEPDDGQRKLRTVSNEETGQGISRPQLTKS